MNKNLKTIAIACLCAVAVLSTGFSAVTLMRVRQLEQNVSAVQHSVTSIDSDINSTLNSAITTITESAQKNASIVSDYSVNWGECSQKDQSMQMTVRIMPKEYSDQTQVRVRYSGYSAKGQGYDMVFDCEGFEEQVADAVRVESGVYEASLTIPLVDYISLSTEVQDGDVVRQEKLENQYSAWGLNLLHPQMSGGFDSYSVKSEDKSSIEYSAFASVNLMTSYDAGGVSNEPKMTGGTVSIYLNDQEVITKTLGEKEETQEDAQQAALVEKSGEVYKVWNNDSGNAPMSWSGEIKNIQDGDIVTFVMKVQDENGFTYQQEVNRTVFTVKDGWIQGTESTPQSSEILVK